MYVGEKHTVTRTARGLQHYRCASCGHAADALVVGVGQGEGASPFFLDREGAQSRAASSAEAAAEENVKLTLGLARCPACGERDAATVRGFWAQAILAWIGSTLMVLGIGWLVYSLQHRASALWIFGPIALATGPLIYWMQYHWKWSTADARVTFLESGEVEALFVKAAEAVKQLAPPDRARSAKKSASRDPDAPRDPSAPHEVRVRR